jgi:hypothetical protein
MRPYLKNNKSSQMQWLTVISAIPEAEIGRISDSRPAQTKSPEGPISTNNNWAWWHRPVIPATQEA